MHNCSAESCTGKSESGCTIFSAIVHLSPHSAADSYCGPWMLAIRSWAERPTQDIFPNHPGQTLLDALAMNRNRRVFFACRD